MKNIYRLNKLIALQFILLLVIMGSCELEELEFPNGPTEGVVENASRADIALIAVGVEHNLRNEMGFYYDATGIIGREVYFFTNSDPRYTGEILGKGGSDLDPAGFYGTRPYAGRYATIKNANLLLQALDKSNDVFTDEEKFGITGYAKTLQAYSLLLAANLQYENGIRTDVIDPDNLGDFVAYTDALTDIESLLQDGADDLAQAGTEFMFALSSGFTGFDTPTTFLQFNRGVAARVKLYKGDKTGVLSTINDSHFNLTSDPAELLDGPEHYFSTAGGDLTNPVFRVPNAADPLVAHPDYTADLLIGDTRINKVALRDSEAIKDGLSSDYDVVIYSSLASNIPIIKNEELMLIYAEAHVGTNNTEAITTINLIRSAYGLTVYSGGTTDADVMNEILYHRRYSLFNEGHRWVDMRRLNRLDELPIDRTDDKVHVQFPRPVSEPD